MALQVAWKSTRILPAQRVQKHFAVRTKPVIYFWPEFNFHACFIVAPPHFEIKLRNQTARRGEPTVLQCEARGEKPIGIRWNMNNKRLDPKTDTRQVLPT